MENFATVIHPISGRRDSARMYPLLARVLPAPLASLLSGLWSPMLLSHIVGLRSRASRKQAEGWLLACPLTSSQMLRLPPQAVYDKIVRAGRLAQRQGARILGLGGLTSAVGDGGVTISQRLNMPVTTGNSLTVGLAVETLRGLAEERGLRMDRSVAAVVGAPGTIGLACAEMLAPSVGRLILVGGQKIWLSQARALAEAAGARKVDAVTRIEAVADADMVLSATSRYRPVLSPRHLKRDAVVCDVALPSTVSLAVTEHRKDVSVVKGATVKVPGPVSLGFDLGLPPGQVFACMAEAMVLALEGRYEAFSLGKRVRREKVREITRLARDHGFQLAARASSEDHADE